MKIGIMSMQRIINYGSFLQAYGLKSTIESMGHSVEFVDYLAEPSLVKTEAVNTGAGLLGKMRNACRMLQPAYRDYRNRQIRMNQSFGAFYRRFQEEFLPELGVTESRNLRPELDVLVIGSDEVFNCTQPGDAVGYSLQLFGADHRAKRLVSYAASFGSTTLEKLDHFGIRDDIKSRLEGFDSLSVRDTNSARIITELCGTVPVQNIDPVLLYEFPEVNEIQIPHKDYIVVYAYAGRIREEEAAAIRAFAKKEGKKILSLGFYQPFCDEYVQTTPMEALAYVKHADYVVTDTFHGTVFSIKYQVPFATLIRESNRQKLGDLLQRFEAEDRSVMELSQLERVLKQPLASEKIRTLLKQYRREAKAYLQDALHLE